nr:protein kinase superfamily protein [Tanacetum cinerariifolium]
MEPTQPFLLLNKLLPYPQAEKGKHFKVRIDGIECNRSLPKGIPFVNNKVIETPKNGIIFTDALDEQAFQRVNDIYKVEVESLLGYLVIARNIKNPKNQRFCVVLRQMINERPDKKKLKSKKVKLEAIR